MRSKAPTDPDAIREMYDWSDPNRYEWVIRGSPSTHRVIPFVGPLIGVPLIIPALSCVAAALAAGFAVSVLQFFYSFIVATTGIELFEGDEELRIVLWHSVGVGMTAMLILLASYNSWLVWRGAPKKSQFAQCNLDELLTSSIGIMMFVLGYLLESGFHGSRTSFEQWLRFFSQRAFSALPIDITELLGIRLSDIEPYTWYTRLGTVFFSFLITAGLVNFLWQVYRRRYRNEIIAGSVKECFWKCRNLLDRDTLELFRKGKIEPIEHPESSVALVDFIEALDEQDYRDEKAEKHP
jgi:hypothetical protein